MSPKWANENDRSTTSLNQEKLGITVYPYNAAHFSRTPGIMATIRSNFIGPSLAFYQPLGWAVVVAHRYEDLNAALRHSHSSLQISFFRFLSNFMAACID